MPLFTKKHDSYLCAAFDEPNVLELMRQTLPGIDRRVLVANGVAAKAEA